MSRLKLKRIKPLDEAKARLSALKSIDPKLDLGNGVSVPAFQDEIQHHSEMLSTYNTMLSQLDELYNKCNDSLEIIKDQSVRLLAGVGAKYGRNSNEYEMAGGTKRSERRKPVVRKEQAAN